jgi:hypothetical protein
MNSDMEDRLRAAFDAKASRVTQVTLQRREPPHAGDEPSDRAVIGIDHRRRRWIAPLLAAAAVIAIAVGTTAVVTAVQADHDRTGPAHTPTPTMTTAPAPTSSSPASPSTPPQNQKSSTTPPSTAAPVAVPPPSDLGKWHYAKAKSVQLGNDYTAVLWLSRRPKSGDDFIRMSHVRPIIELTHGGVAAQWWSSPVTRGFGWVGSLTCSTAGPEVNCGLTGERGAHGAYGVVLVLRGGQLRGNAFAASDAPNTEARDLNGDGYLDMVGVDSDYTPDYGTGHFFGHTYRYAGAALKSTGCVPMSTFDQPRPTKLVYGTCPVP